MPKKYIVDLSEEERDILNGVVLKLKGGYQKIRRAQILLKANINGLSWTDKQISEAFDCTTRAVENTRKTLVLEGFNEALERKKRVNSPNPKKFNGEQEAKVIALRLGSPPEGFSNWSLRLLTKRVIELGIVDSVSEETIRTTLKKMV